MQLIDTGSGGGEIERVWIRRGDARRNSSML